MIYDFDFQNIRNKKILIQLSGGKDSIACLVLLKEKHIECSAIHFIHDYAYSIPTSEAKRICKKYNIELQIIDITKEIKELLLNNHINRPCRLCKGIMDKKTVEFAIKNKFDFICTGDSRDDTSLIARLKEYNGSDLFIGDYFNKAVELPSIIKIIRPLITTSSTEILEYLKKIGITVNRVNDTGDKYFEYSREGCPIQFKDFYADYSEDMLIKLKKYNILCSEFAKNKGIKASIHLPSEFIVTIPKGYERACFNYLKQNGCELKDNHDIRSIDNLVKYFLFLEIPKNSFDKNKLKQAITRFVERLTNSIINENPEFIAENLILSSKSIDLNLRYISKEGIIMLFLLSKERYETLRIKNIALEIFHTDNISVIEQNSCVNNIILFENNFTGNYGFIKDLNEEIVMAFDSLGYKIHRASTFDEGEEIIKSINIVFSIELGKYSIFRNNKTFYDYFSIPHFQWIFDNPNKNIIDCISKNIHYIFVDLEFHLVCKKLVNRPLFLPIGFFPKANNKISLNEKKDAILFPCQIRNIEEITKEINEQKVAKYIYDFLENFEYDESYIRQFNKYLNKHRNKIFDEHIFFRLTNSYLRVYKRLMVVSSISSKDVYIIGKSNYFEFKNQKRIHYLKEIPYNEIFKLTSQFKYILNVDPNFYATYHDRLLRTINSGSLCITNENSIISHKTGYTACYKFSDVANIDNLILQLDKNYDEILTEQKNFIYGLDWISSINKILKMRGIKKDEL